MPMEVGNPTVSHVCYAISPPHCAGGLGQLLATNFKRARLPFAVNWDVPEGEM